MSDKKYHVHLPKTDFPMKADLPRREPAILEEWDKMGLYRRLQEASLRRPPFVLHDGPPYANGPLHMGHALNKILKDFVVKSRLLRGYRSPYIPGWDCHGLPIEHQLMKEKKWTKATVSPREFRRAAADYAEKWIAVQKTEFKRLGVLADWENPYKTMASDYEAGVARVFFDLFKAGYIARDKKPVYWCLHCETALAEAEVEYAEKSSPSIFVKFPVTLWPAGPLGQKLAALAGPRAHALVWTTTPWTLPANQALAFHKRAPYSLWKAAGAEETFLVGKPGLDVLKEILGPGEILAETTGAELKGLAAVNPLLPGKKPRAVFADFVSQEEGAGIVHIAPGHGREDYSLAGPEKLQVFSPLDDAGRFTPESGLPELTGKTVWEANPLVIDQLEKSGALLLQPTPPFDPHGSPEAPRGGTITHSYPHCWRCKNPVIFRATEQWFLKVAEDFRKALMRSTALVTWTPGYGEERLLGMLTTRPDWCLSRQRLWGTPIPMFRCVKCPEHWIADEKVFAHVEALFQKEGTGAWFEKSAAELLPPGTTCPLCRGSDFEKEKDILDVWFDSGASWTAVLARRPETRDVPREKVMYLEGSDQHRGWFQTSLLPALAVTGEPPFGHVTTHGFVLDGQGRAMSKSMGNVIAPQEIIAKFGADVVRLWVAVTDYREDVRLSPDILNRVADAYRKIRNTLRFLLGNLADFDPARHAVPVEKMTLLDRSVLQALNELIAHVGRRYDAQEFHLAATALGDGFCVHALSEYYLDVLKDVLYCDPADSPRRRSAQTAFWILARSLAKLLAPLVSFTAEETWRTLAAEGHLEVSDDAASVFLNPFPTRLPLPADTPALSALLALRRRVNTAVEKARQAGTVKGLTDAAIALEAEDDQPAFRALTEEDWAGLLGVAGAAVTLMARPSEEATVTRALGEKCPRCWIVRTLTPEGLCARCLPAERAAAIPVPGN
jgi:isoleucyl-tRNA synthetase